MVIKEFTSLGISGTVQCTSKDEFETLIKKLNFLSSKFSFFNYETTDWKVTFKMGREIRTIKVGIFVEDIRKRLGAKDINVICM